MSNEDSGKAEELENDKKGISIPNWVYGAIVGGALGYYFLAPSPEEQAEECISNHAVTLAQQYTNDKVSSEVMGYSDTKILSSPKNSGYHLLDFNVRLLMSANSGNYSQQENIPVKGFKCFYDNSKFDEWKKNNN